MALTVTLTAATPLPQAYELRFQLADPVATPPYNVSRAYTFGHIPSPGEVSALLRRDAAILAGQGAFVPGPFVVLPAPTETPQEQARREYLALRFLALQVRQDFADAQNAGAVTAGNAAYAQRINALRTQLQAAFQDTFIP